MDILHLLRIRYALLLLLLTPSDAHHDSEWSVTQHADECRNDGIQLHTFIINHEFEHWIGFRLSDSDDNQSVRRPAENIIGEQNSQIYTIRCGLFLYPVPVYMIDTNIFVDRPMT